MLVAYAWGIERILTAAAGSELMPGHSVSARGYVQQLLSGQGRPSGAERLKAYLGDAIRLLNRTHGEVQAELNKFAESLVEALNPERLEESVEPGILGRLFGMQGAYWREYKVRMKNLDASGVRQIVEDQRRRRTQSA